MEVAVAVAGGGGGRGCSGGGVRLHDYSLGMDVPVT